MPVPPDALTLVLFGMPDSGKSSLLGALLQTALKHPDELGGTLDGIDAGLQDLRERVYQTRTRETLQEIVPHRVAYDPEGLAAPVGLILYDCDGRVANDILTHRRPIADAAKQEGLAKRVLSADGLILTVDAAAPDEQVETDFREFAKFLGVVREHRGGQLEAADWPVTLVLTKVDRLGRDDLTLEEWEKILADKRLAVRERFAVVVRESGRGFGSLELAVKSTAVKRPGLRDAVPEDDEPFGVGELFRDSITRAGRFRARSKMSATKLSKTALIVVGMFLLVFGLAGWLFRERMNGGSDPLRDKVADARLMDEPLPQRLAAGIGKRLTPLGEIRSDAGFPGLPANDQEFVNGRIDEYRAYEKFRDQVADRSLPDKGLTLTSLRSRLDGLKALTPPAAYGDDWDETPAVAQRDKQIALASDILARAGPAIEAARKRIEELEELAGRDLSPTWAVTASAELLKGLTSDSLADPKFLAVEEVGAVAKARTEAEAKLAQLRDLAAALGLTVDPTDPAAVLAIPDLSKAMAGRLAALTERRDRLNRLYPDAKNWSLALLPERHRKALRRGLERAQERLILEGQALVLEKLALTKPDTLADWRGLVPWLKGDEFAPWRDLYRVASAPIDANAPDPVEELAAFVAKDAHPLTIRGLRLTLPDALKAMPLKPSGPFMLYYGDPVTETAFRAVGQPIAGDGATTYFFEPAAPWSVNYAPGTAMFALLDLKEGEGSWRLTWARSRSKLFQTERLRREPRLHRPDKNVTEGDSVSEVKLVITGDWPTVPSLIPVVRVP